ncbi:hypothetical protein BZB76_1842 [Actinomadura pelletieri DSM 43383]|uniref:Uncharacterized protein n=1 Tax=Actinomadura pelletieri DSM 43383 TaxID=1120940 RepID=A0A495QSJ7_9ACTN|nr:hypothetical protein [Actinomadura pelletieri]RKS76486.1 hypothetical protein BZB76_1842 [Actinomadura pelletieri DSM 43383]
MSDGRYELYGKNGIWIIAETGGPVVAAFYSVDGHPGWWRGHAFGRVKRTFVPGDPDPVDVARRFIDADPSCLVVRPEPASR